MVHLKDEPLQTMYNHAFQG